MKNPGKKSNQAVNILYFSIVLNAVLAIVKGAAGYFGNSYALIADSIESTSDIFSSGLLLFGIKYASRPADSNHPYGHGKAEPLVTFIAVGFLVASASIIAYESILNIITPDPQPRAYTLIVLAGVMIVKELFYRIVLRKSEQSKSSALRADAWHHRSDALTSLTAFVGIALAIWLGKGFDAADDWAALVAAGFILYNSFLIFRPALAEIMDEGMHDEMIAEIRAVSGTVEGVIDTEKCYIRKSGMNFFVDLHITVKADITVREGHDIAHDLKSAIINEMPEVADVLIHIEPEL